MISSVLAHDGSVMPRIRKSRKTAGAPITPHHAMSRGGSGSCTFGGTGGTKPSSASGVNGTGFQVSAGSISGSGSKTASGAGVTVSASGTSAAAGASS